ncbi:hypothetical protein LMG28688_05367 [Paraburkholderia caffeinitolerans]|uniref:BON domain-containing protein n=1 Tax=Paraburkholderia caffeinitolerans TaxID=1723730 RepID=A0A6J5GIF2_9BURK|nr:BON domain-containing protein [Paraburkholderia caffeinitolerans]CAB3801482.1 hypothetical protein LMG28688_05367 [Paraburkholderia caffeinitolerans]
MDFFKSMRGVAGVFIMTVAVAGHAQVSGAVEAGAAVSASTSNAGRKAEKAENRRLQKEVLRHLLKTKGLDANNIVVVARGGVVTLGGSVPQAHEAELAVALARGVEGVKEVRSNLAVRPEGL